MENNLWRKKFVFLFYLTLLTLLLLTSSYDGSVVGANTHSPGDCTRQKSKDAVEESGTDLREQTKAVPASSELPGVRESLNKVTSQEPKVELPSAQEHNEKETLVNMPGPHYQQQAISNEQTTGRKEEEQDGHRTNGYSTSSRLQHLKVFDGKQERQHKGEMSQSIDGEQSVESPDSAPGSERSVEDPGTTPFSSEPSVEDLSNAAPSCEQLVESPSEISGSKEPVESYLVSSESDHVSSEVPDTSSVVQCSDDIVQSTDSEQSSVDAPNKTPSSEALAAAPDGSNKQSGTACEKIPMSEQSFESPDSGRQKPVVDDDMTSSVIKSFESSGTCSELSDGKSVDEVHNSEQPVPKSETISKSGQPVKSHQLKKDPNNPANFGNNDEETEMEKDTDEPGDELYAQGEELIAKLNFQAKARGYELLKEAADMGNTKALEKIAYGYLFGNALKRNLTKAFEIFTSLADKGVPAGQLGLGFIYSTGIGVDSSQAKAVLYYTLAALGGHPLAQMAIGYRASVGVTTTENCESALSYYHKAASHVVTQVSLFTGGQAVQKARLSEDEEGDGPSVFGGITEDEVERYRDVFADTGAQLSLGMYYMFGLGGTERNLKQAVHYLEKAVDSDPGTAYALLGRIYAEGSPPEIPQSNEKALLYFKKAIEEGSADGHSGLGILYFKGMGVEKDHGKAMLHFGKAADRGSPEAYFYLGMGFLYGLGKPQNPAKAISNLKIAAQAGHVLAIFHLGEMNAKGGSGRRDCQQAVEWLKSVSERGRWSKMLREAYKMYLLGDVDSALVMYLYLGELGYEVAQTNAAYILEEDKIELMDQNETLKRALVLWSRSATQGYSVARVKLGDYYYYGLGTETNLEEAVDQYRMAADHMANSQAMFNLGYMYELGIGLQQDIHLAKRYYDMAVAHNPAAALPANIALIKVHAKLWQEYAHEYFSHSKLYNVMFAEGESYFGDSWDIYLIGILCVVLAVVIRWHRR